MNLIDIETIMRDMCSIKHEHSFKRYLKLIEIYRKLNLSKKSFGKGEIEAHHILPSKIWQEYKKEKWNIVNLPVRAHVIAHYLLYKFLPKSECVFAFNQMHRVSVKTGKLNARLYAKARIELAQLVSKVNSGRKWSDEQHKLHRKIHCGKNTYRNITSGECKKFIVGDEPAGWEPFQTGRTKSIAAKEKMGESMSGRIWQYHSESKEVKFANFLIDGFTKGIPPWFVYDHAEITKTYKWAYNPDTNEVIRCAEIDIPVGFELGRDPSYVNKGFEKINQSGLCRMLDIEDKCYTLVSEDILPNPRYVKHGACVDDIYVILYKDSIYYSWVDVEREHPELPKMNKKRDISLLDYVVPKKHFNQTPDRQRFCEMHHGKTFGEIGISMRKLKENDND